VDAALGQQFGTLRANAFDHTYSSGEGLRGHDRKRSNCERRLDPAPTICIVTAK
jgi:hypothetical protein